MKVKSNFIDSYVPYTVVVVIDGKFGSPGTGSYRTEKDVLSQIRLIDNSKTEYAVLTKSELGADLDAVIGVMQPILSGMLGKLGDNMHFAIFPGKNGKGERLADPTKAGSLRIRLQPGREFGWQFPLASLLPLKICPIDKAEMSGGWKYCPFHGAELK